MNLKSKNKFASFFQNMLSFPTNVLRKFSNAEDFRSKKMGKEINLSDEIEKILKKYDAKPQSAGLPGVKAVPIDTAWSEEDEERFQRELKYLKQVLK